MAEESANEALSSSKFGIRRKWSTPTTGGYGIDLLFNRSDKKYYLHKCSHCNHWNKMTFGLFEDGGNLKIINPDGIHEDTKEVEDGSVIYVCNRPDCGKPLDRWYNGQWVAENPNVKSLSGYAISQMNAVWITGDMMYRKYLTAKSKQTFYNYVVGEPYQDESLALADVDVLNHRRKSLPQRLENRGDYKLISIGIDWGVTHSVIVMGRKQNGEEDIINMFSVKETAGFTGDVDRDVREIIERCRLYEPDLIVADIGYNGSRINTLVKAFGKKVYGVQVNPAKSNGQVDAQWNDSTQRVTIDKLTQNRIMLEKIKTGNQGFWCKVDPELLMYIEHWKNVIIRDVEDDDGVLSKEILRKGDDHFAQSSVYANIAMTRLTKAMITTKNSFGYTEVNSSERVNMNQAFDDLLRRPER